VDGVECDAHIGTSEEDCDGADFASYVFKFGPLISFFCFTVTVMVIGCPVGGRGIVLVST
jgi:hypothetical protein